MNDIQIQKYIDSKAYLKIYRDIGNEAEDLTGFILAQSQELLLIRPDLDFLLDGFTIVRKKDVKRLRHSNSERTIKKIMKAEGFMDNILEFQKPLSLVSWTEIFKTLKKYDFHVIVETVEATAKNKEGVLHFWIGPIRKVMSEAVSIHNYNNNGLLDAGPTTIKFEEIHTLKFDDRYSTIFRKYLRTPK